ncbi:hypothetical protein [Microbulbifer variabilis]|uniref:hypothetical protein n=1 Tax=Microbulbifer variabilis TaxID=266805 RepID=UPI001CFC4FC7|nr:hypothetical protein [Microbulbifer variabilis]
MKSLITPAVILVMAAYLGIEGLRLTVGGEAFASTSVVTLPQNQQGKGIEQDFSRGNVKKGEMLGGSEMMEFEGDVFADVPEHMGADKGVGQRNPSGEESPKK